MTQTVFDPKEILESMTEQINVGMTWDEVFALEKESPNSCISPNEQDHLYL
jgi:hypothetical protein